MRGRDLDRRRLLRVGGATLAGVVAGCLQERPAADDPHLGEPEPYAAVDLRRDDGGSRFEPPLVHLIDGGTVEWTVASGVHDVTTYHPESHGDQRRIPDGADPFRSGRLTDEGAPFDRTFVTEGVFDVCCTRHEAGGMVGSVVVGWPDPDDEPALTRPVGTIPPAASDALERRTERVRTMLEEAHGD